MHRISNLRRFIGVGNLITERTMAAAEDVDGIVESLRSGRKLERDRALEALKRRLRTVTEGIV